MANTNEIPDHIDDVSAAWLNEVLHSGGHLTRGHVERISSERVGVGIGVLADLARIDLTYSGANPEAPSSVVVKLQSHVAENRAFAIEFSFYERELLFYKHVARDVPGRTPVIYGLQSSPEQDRFAIVMEDLSHLDIFDQIAGLDIEHTRIVVDWMATLHARFWNNVDSEVLSFIPYGDDDITLKVGELYEHGWEPFVQIFGKHLPEGGKELGAIIRENFLWILQQMIGGPVTIVHTDLRLDNMFFDENGNVVPIDWQVSVRTRGTYDLAYFLGGSLTIADRRSYEQDLVRRYVDKLRVLGVTDYPFDEAWQDYRLSHMVCTVVPVNGVLLDKGNERGVQLINVLTERHFTAALDLNSASLIEQLKRSD
ncbi:MAG: phosphotransferase [Acidimicrobiales bacterium]